MNYCMIIKLFGNLALIISASVIFHLEGINLLFNQF